MPPKPKYSDGERVLCFHGPLMYEAKTVKSEAKEKTIRYLIHYNGWNKSWDEWVPESRVLKYCDASLQKQKELKKAHDAKTKQQRAAKNKKNAEKEKEKEKAKEKEEAEAAKKESKERSSTPVIDKRKGKKEKAKEKAEKEKAEKEKAEREAEKESDKASEDGSTTSRKRSNRGRDKEREKESKESESKKDKEKREEKEKEDEPKKKRIKSEPAVELKAEEKEKEDEPRKKRLKIEVAVESTPDVKTPVQEETYMTKVEVKVKYPDELKPWLVDDHDHINRQKQLVNVPCKITVDSILEDFTKAKLAKPNNPQKDAFVEVANGIRDYFNAMLGTQLLYKFERPQYAEILANHPDKPMSQIYGATHLLRLFVRIGGMLAYTTLDDKTMQLLTTHLHDFLKFVVKNSGTYLQTSDYTLAPPEYHRKAL